MAPIEASTSARGRLLSPTSTAPRTCVPTPTCTSSTAVAAQAAQPKRVSCAGAAAPAGRAATSDSTVAHSRSCTMTSATTMCAVTIHGASSCATTRPPSQPW